MNATAPAGAAELKRELDQLIAQLLGAVSFDAGQTPRYRRLHDLFIEAGVLVNATGATPEVFGVDRFIETRMASFEAGTVTRYRVLELDADSVSFGKVAHRQGVIAREGMAAGERFESRGMLFAQFVLTQAGWRFSSVAWDDLRPGVRLIARSEPTEFGAY
ncbi:hypothetical protein [Rivibacter subsaxonicus]|uniref:SnoaL-like protein n=1 Tax=Rivibacter subsaxonicus TaxID=457575 RepID=A0A4Q7VVV0_9BURK|nr:hypothetical protein [Rivibacter subsaxonicus]RZU00814.1 hypothetical protein EV670_1527 [Rivibacter subsaxonicus]